MSAATFGAALIALALLRPRVVGAADLLAVQPLPGKSHWNVMSAVLRALTDRGHRVTVFTPFLDGDRENYTEVDSIGNLRLGIGLDAEYLIANFGTAAGVISNMANATRRCCATVYKHPRMREILADAEDGRPGRFDAVITEPYVSECVSYAAAVLRVPLIYVVPPPVPTYLERSLFGHAPNPAAVPHLLSRRGALVTFADRFVNAALTVYCSLLVWRAERSLRLSDPQPFDLAGGTVKPSLTFVNTHFITEPSRPLPPTVVQIGGIHLAGQPPRAIPADILEFIDGSPNGVIYFTFGSVVSMSSIPKHIQKAFRDALARVPQRVLWKYEGEMEDKPKNVMTREWFPQRDILMHPNVRLFISHGGISGVYEAVDAGVPVLGFPFFSDQPRNLANLVDAGMAISMELLSVSEEMFLNAVLELVNDEKYKKNAEIVSKRFKDRPMSPAESVVYWTEYVLRHKGAPNLMSHAMSLTWYQYFLVDVIFTFLLTVSVIIFLIYFCLKNIVKYIFKYFHSSKEKCE